VLTRRELVAERGGGTTPSRTPTEPPMPPRAQHLLGQQVDVSERRVGAERRLDRPVADRAQLRTPHRQAAAEGHAAGLRAVTGVAALRVVPVLGPGQLGDLGLVISAITSRLTAVVTATSPHARARRTWRAGRRSRQRAGLTARVRRSRPAGVGADGVAAAVNIVVAGSCGRVRTQPVGPSSDLIPEFLVQTSVCIALATSHQLRVAAS
jgi:hypothetical protein